MSNAAVTQLSPAFNASGPAKERLEKALENGYVITTGQQPGLFGGPLYTLYKALSALAIADELQKKGGVPVAPVFWAATDDSDFEEASSVHTPDGEKIEIQPAGAVGTVLAEMPLGDISQQLEKLRKASEPVKDEVPLVAVQNSYVRSATIGGAYVSLLRAILEPLGIAVLDSFNKAVRQAAFPTLSQALAQADEIAEALERKNAEIESAGKTVQVPEVKGLSLVFNRQDNRRRRVPIKGARKVLRDAYPGDFTWNVLLRPVIERQILPTRLYIAGPSEMAYFEQSQAVAQAMGLEQPVAAPRWSDGTERERTVNYIPLMANRGQAYMDEIMPKIREHATMVVNG